MPVLRDVMPVLRDKDLVPMDQKEAQKTYLFPKLKRLAPEQANLLLTSHARFGDAEARDLLEMLIPESSQERCHKDQPTGFRESRF